MIHVALRDNELSAKAEERRKKREAQEKKRYEYTTFNENEGGLYAMEAVGLVGDGQGVAVVLLAP